MKTPQNPAVVKLERELEELRRQRDIMMCDSSKSRMFRDRAIGLIDTDIAALKARISALRAKPL